METINKEGDRRNFSRQKKTILAIIALMERFSWAGKNSEIEFLKVIDNRIIPVEVKSGHRTKAKSLLVYKNKYAPPLQIKITANNLHRENPQMHNYPLYLAGKIK
jgi:hypothetical protein